MRRERDVYIAIMVAEEKGVGLHLSFEELQALTLDDAISTRALNGLTSVEWGRVRDIGWAHIDPYASRVAANEAVDQP